MRILELMQLEYEKEFYKNELLFMAKRILTKELTKKRLEKVSYGIAINCLIIMLILVVKELI